MENGEKNKEKKSTLIMGMSRSVFLGHYQTVCHDGFWGPNKTKKILI